MNIIFQAIILKVEATYHGSMKQVNYKAIFGENVKRLRLSSGLTQERLSERVGVSAQHLSYIESGNKAPSFDLVVALAASLGATPGHLFEDSTSRPEKIERAYVRIQELISGLSKSELNRVLQIISLATTSSKKKK